MESIVIDRQILPEIILSYIHSDKIRMSEENGNIILSPIDEPFDYTQWQENLFENMTIEEISKNATEYRKQNKM
jgi:hypothetical protein